MLSTKNVLLLFINRTKQLGVEIACLAIPVNTAMIITVHRVITDKKSRKYLLINKRERLLARIDLSTDNILINK